MAACPKAVFWSPANGMDPESSSIKQALRTFGKEATRLACKSSAKRVETRFLIRERLRGWAFTDAFRDLLALKFQMATLSK